MPALTGPHQLPSNGEVNSLVVMLHGYGADGQDLIGLAPFFQQALPNTAFHSPDGPQACELSPLGRQWFSLERTDPEFLRRNSATQAVGFEGMLDGAREAAPLVQDYIDGLMTQYDLQPHQVFLLGFSQGTMMSLHVGLRQKTPFAGIVGFSGALVGASVLAEEITSPCPTLLVHGTADEMLPVHAVDLAKKGLMKANLTPHVIKCENLPHSIDQEGAMAAAQFMKDHLGA
ncbi:phospholipase [Terasakiella sp. A23]|uniref:alpha/beta hydrolase n=1 Tax=Terasakiella sp. FCG-A23 TaxID=3080561 RepID=UPI0029550C57|nr:dienelactone hydrolase family protein [Terasakiella sp. A23]MDV7339399.1 phospholipase [Terasakiella sp. A23]